jgi:hypothetical protein
MFRPSEHPKPHIHGNSKLQSRSACSPDSSRTHHPTHRQCRPCLQQLYNRYNHRPSPSFSPSSPMHPNPLDGVDLLQHPLARLLPIVQKAKTDLTAPDPKILPRLATRRRIRHRINPDNPDSCPSCLGRNETCDHVMRCRERRRADLHSSPIDDLWPPPLYKASQAGTATPNTKYQSPGTIVSVRTESFEKRSPTKMISAGAACTPAKSPKTSKLCIMLTVPGVVAAATPTLPASPTGPPS